jgi:hypothetical protein|tara:strand:+ start:3162 stop:3500 length:339 start_codon:yes stop_codon:yes gene_type:complete
MKHESNCAKTNIITLDAFRVTPRKKTSKEAEEIQNDQVVNAFHDACIKISDKVDVKGYALVAWDEKGVPCISWSCGHVKSPISELMLPTFTQSVFQGILNKKLSTPEDLKDE